MKTVYELQQLGDCEGKTSYTVAFFTDEEVAKAVGKTGYGDRSMGGHFPQVTPHTVYSSANEFYQANDKADPTNYVGPGEIDAVQLLRERALAKLTDAERRALGVS